MDTAASGGAPGISVVIPHLNDPAAAALCLASVAAQNYAGPVEVLLVDNGSTVPLDALKAAHPDVVFLEEPRPGPGHARNTGVAAASHAILAFIDADCRAAPDWLAAAAEGVAATGGAIGGEVLIAYRDPAAPTALEAFEAVFAFRQALYVRHHRFSVTANMAMPRGVFDRVGPFGGIDIAEDLDWGRRADALGCPVSFWPAMLVHHPARPTMADLQRKWRRHIAHALAEERGRAGWRWPARAAAVALSALPHAATVVRSPRLSGPGQRIRAIGVLFAIRVWRAGEMLRQARGGGNAAGQVWNRG